MVIEVGATPSAVGSLTQWNLTGSCGDVDVTACGDLSKQFLTDLPDDGGRMATLWNGADAGQMALQAAYRSGALIPIHVYPTGTKVAGTDKEFFGNVRITGLEIGGGVSSAFTAEFTYKGALEYRTIPT